MRPPPSLVLPLLLSFATGVLLLQWQGELPSRTSTTVVAAIAVASAIALRRFWPWVPELRPLAALLALTAAGAIGFAYAAARADVRLADALPSEWEGEDITVVGIVDDLPQSSERGT